MKDTTNNIMELTAVIESLKYVLDILKKEKNYNILLNNVKNNKKMDIEIYADSSYVLKGITEWIENWIKKDFKNVKNVELWKTLYSLKKQIEELPSVNLIFNKVKGHNGDKYNEMVDKLASNAAMEVN